MRYIKQVETAQNFTIKKYPYPRFGYGIENTVNITGLFTTEVKMKKLTKKQEQAIKKFDEMFNLVELQKVETKRPTSIRVSDNDKKWIKKHKFSLQGIFDFGLRIAKSRNK